jgi:two-component system CheB/CheR fusion protein
MAANNQHLFVTGIGSSAGGLQALQTFVSNLPASDDTAYVIVPHLKSDFKSRLAAILSKETALDVLEIKDGDPIEAGKIYVLPSGFKLTIRDQKLRLEKRPAMEKINRAINHFFISLAHAYRDHVFGVILSGTGNDGVEGVKEIEDFGGIVLVQDPATAEFDGMPVNTIHQDHPDYVLSPDQMPRLINQLKEERKLRWTG